MQSFFDVWQYMPHGMCLLWQPWLVLLWAGSDALIFAAYMAIPFSLMRVVRGRSDLKHRGMIMLFAGFILLCGLTHLLGIVTLWWPIYPVVGVVKLATGLVSILTAVVLFRLVPALIAIPSMSELEAMNRQLLQKVAEHEAAEAELRAVKERLEETVADRTAELKRANAKMAVVAREAVHRSKNLLTVVGSIARQSARGQSGIDEYVATLLGRIDALAGATETVMGGRESSSADFRSVVENQLGPLLMTYGDRIRIEGPSLPVSSEAAQQIGLALHELATNAQKHGALATESGDVSISWKVLNSGADQDVMFQWSETSAGEADDAVSSSGGFGHVLLSRIVPAMLQGTAQRAKEQDRLTYVLTIPARMLATDATSAGDAIMASRIVEADFGLS